MDCSDAFSQCDALKIAEFTGAVPDYYLPGKESSSPGDTEAMDEPYYWTMSLTGMEYAGEGTLADVVLYFDDSALTVRINGRELLTTDYYADRNADNEDRIVSTNGFFCRDGQTKEIRFHTGSEESLYIRLE